MLLGVIADDFTGATDVASMLVAAGLRTVQTIGIPADAAAVGDADAVVVALKTRTIPAPAAVAESLAALAWLKSAGARQFYFKYCSTFDSTDAGNIGPVADALLDALGADFTIACPAFPENKRTIYQGHLFVGEVLLSDSPMRNHPLTPMTDANLVRVLARQTRRKVGLVPFATVTQGAEAIRAAFARLRGEGVTYAVVDALQNRDLLSIGEACRDLPLVTAGSGVALGLPENFVQAKLVPLRADASHLPAVGGKVAVLAGSCSAATREQIAVMGRSHLAVAIDPLSGGNAQALAQQALAAIQPALAADKPFLVYSSAAPEAVAEVQRRLGQATAATLVEDTLALAAQELVARGVRRLVIAGGETSGAVVKALGVTALAIGPTIDPGVPWTLSLGEPRLKLALKSGNFGGPDFFEKALTLAA
jgi:uncharacterized protein YgbK (DUF1537 family)